MVFDSNFNIASNFHCVVYLSVISLTILKTFTMSNFVMRFYCTHGKHTHMDKNKALLNISNINLLVLDVSTRKSSSVIQEREYQVVN